MPSRRSSRIARGAFAALVLALSPGLSSCVWHEHTVGLGPSGIGQESGRQFYLFFGLLRLNEVDSQRMTHDLRGYRITTEFAFIDLILAPLFLPLTVTTRTVTVER
ncbi:MAG: hypothetical protein HZB39_16350 [Planctomycetes bacterium]|nr:hypothetical protein [Planctomycetota bacterium]